MAELHAKSQSMDTQRILSEINRINVDLGYIKNPDNQRSNSVESYFYPRPAYSPLHEKYNNGVPLSPSIRNNIVFETMPNMAARQIIHEHSVLLPDLEKNLQLIKDRMANITVNVVPVMGTVDSDVTTVVEYAPAFLAYLEKIRKSKEKRVKHKDSDGNESEKSVVLPDTNKLIAEDFIMKNLTFMVPESLESRSSSRIKNATQQIKLFFKPAKETKKSDPPIITTVSPPEVEFSAEEGEEESDKAPFGSLFNREKETTLEAMKKGGVIIKRLRVRNGGIAIAGPGGVATAGSGGTAIVGPGGIALTHPRSLAIVGPGAKVVAVPQSTDLGKLALESTGRKFADTLGVVVATGPVIYYNNSVRK